MARAPRSADERADLPGYRRRSPRFSDIREGGRPRAARGLLRVTALAALFALGACKNDTTNTRGGSADADAMGGVGASTSKQPEGQPAGGNVQETVEETKGALGENTETVDSKAFPVGGTQGPVITGKLPPTGGPNRPLLPPARPGESISRFEGCLASANPSESDGARYPAQAKTRSANAQLPLRAIPTGGGAIVEHTFGHACCLKGTVFPVVEGNTVTLTTSLEGTPCRCLCESTVRTAIGLGPGTYTVKVKSGEGQNPTAVGETTVTVP